VGGGRIEAVPNATNADLLTEFDLVYVVRRAAIRLCSHACLDRMLRCRFRYEGQGCASGAYSMHGLWWVCREARPGQAVWIGCGRDGPMLAAGRGRPRGGLRNAVEDHMRQGLSLVFTTVGLDTAAGWAALAHHTTEFPGTEPAG
jgi:hypothetical protein